MSDEINFGGSDDGNISPIESPQWSDKRRASIIAEEDNTEARAAKFADDTAEININQNGIVKKFLVPSYLVDDMSALEKHKIRRQRACSVCCPGMIKIFCAIIISTAIILAAIINGGCIWTSAYYLRKLKI